MASTSWSGNSANKGGPVALMFVLILLSAGICVRIGRKPLARNARDTLTDFFVVDLADLVLEQLPFQHGSTLRSEIQELVSL